MIRDVSRCPYCKAVSAGVDDDLPDLIVAPDRADGRPCPHLAFVCVSLNAYRPGTGDEVRERTGHWLWVRGEGVRGLPEGPVDPLSSYVDEIGYGMLGGDSLPTTEYRVDGGPAGERDRARSGSGDFPLATRDGRGLRAFMDGNGLYSPNPDALVREVRRLILRGNRLGPDVERARPSAADRDFFDSDDPPGFDDPDEIEFYGP